MASLIPEADLVRKTVTLRVMDAPNDVVLTKDSLLRWMCLSLGLISEKESRDTVVKIFDSLLSFQVAGVDPSAEKMGECLSGVGEKTLRYHLKRMQDMGVVEKNGKGYRFVRDPTSPRLDAFTDVFLKSVITDAGASADKVFKELLGKY